MNRFSNLQIHYISVFHVHVEVGEDDPLGDPGGAAGVHHNNVYLDHIGVGEDDPLGDPGGPAGVHHDGCVTRLGRAFNNVRSRIGCVLNYISKKWLGWASNTEKISRSRMILANFQNCFQKKIVA